METIFAYAQTNMSVNGAAKMMHYTRSAVDYNLNSIYKMTGLNPKNFYDLMELIRLIQEKMYGTHS